MCVWLCFRISISSYLGFLFQLLISLLKSLSVALSFQKVCLVFKVRFLRRCVFQVVSVTVALKLRLIRVFQGTKNGSWQSGNRLQILATNKAFKRDSQRLAVLV
ncbi:TPA: hypothetical protein I7282_23455 [Vibrio parahaemolyticus]|nr:hypothetical protein [Vibrio parahaemolyticus]